MITHTAIAQKINARLFYGWIMLGVGFVGMFATGPGQSFTISIFVNPLIAELGISRTSISSAYAVGTLSAALGLSYVGRLIDRLGPRLMLALLAFLLGIVCLLFPLVAGLAALYVAFTAVRFFGQGSLMLGSTNLVSQWFVRRRGLALSVTTLGFALASAAYPPVVQLMIGHIGWRMSWVWLGLFVWVLLVPLVLLVVVNRPEDLNLLPDGDSRPPPEDAKAAAAPSPAEVSYTLGEAVRTSTFWVLALALAIPSMLVTGVVFHQISYFEKQGLSAQMAADIFPITALSMVVFLMVFGQLLDRFETRFVVGGGLLLLAAALWVMRIADTPALATVYGLVLGAASGSMMTNTTYVWPRYFGRKHLGSVQGAATTVGIIGASIGPLPFAVAYDVLGGYHEVVLLLSLLPVVAGVAVCFTRPPARRSS